MLVNIDQEESENSDKTEWLVLVSLNSSTSQCSIHHHLSLTLQNNRINPSITQLIKVHSLDQKVKSLNHLLLYIC